MSLEIKFYPHQITVLYGENGSGKSDVIKSLASSPEKSEIAFAFQERGLFPQMSVFENIELPLRVLKLSKKEREARVERWLDVFRISDLRSRRPSEISGGQAQKVNLARAFASEKSKMVLQEPLAALDFESAEIIKLGVREYVLRNAVAILWVTGNLEEARSVGDQFYKIAAGICSRLE